MSRVREAFAHRFTPLRPAPCLDSGVGAARSCGQRALQRSPTGSRPGARPRPEWLSSGSPMPAELRLTACTDRLLASSAMSLALQTLHLTALRIGMVAFVVVQADIQRPNVVWSLAFDRQIS